MASCAARMEDDGPGAVIDEALLDLPNQLFAFFDIRLGGSSAKNEGCGRFSRKVTDNRRLP